MRKLKLFFACLLMAVLSIGQVWAVTITGAAYQGKGGTSGSGGNATATVDGVTITSTKAYYASDTEIREYQNGTVTISSSSTITNIVITCTANNRANFSTTTGTLSAKGTSPQTWEGSATSVTFTADAQSRWSSIEVTLSGGSSTPTVNVDPASFDFGDVYASASASKTFSVSGSNLTSGQNLTLTAPSGYSVNPTSITVSSATLGATNVTVSKDKNTTGANNGNLSITGGGLSSAKTVALTMNIVEDPTPATLPFNFDGGKGDIAGTDGMEQSGLGNDYSSTANLRFDNAGDYVIIYFTGEPNELTYDIKGNSLSGSYQFDVQQSADGVAYTNVASHTSITGSEVTKKHSLASTSRYVKFIYTTKSSGNVGIGTIGISAAPTVCANPVFDPAAGEVASGTNVSITTATAGASIYYTMGANPANPTSGSTLYEGPISVTSSTTIKAIAIKDGLTNSSVTSATYTVVEPRTVTFDAGTGTPESASLTEASYGAGITLPSATPSSYCAAEGWTFAGWATSNSTTTAPTLKEGDPYDCTETTLYAVYQLGDENYHLVTTLPTGEDIPGNYLVVYTTGKLGLEAATVSGKAYQLYGNSISKITDGVIELADITESFRAKTIWTVTYESNHWIFYNSNTSKYLYGYVNSTYHNISIKADKPTGFDVSLDANGYAVLSSADAEDVNVYYSTSDSKFEGTSTASDVNVHLYKQSVATYSSSPSCCTDEVTIAKGAETNGTFTVKHGDDNAVGQTYSTCTGSQVITVTCSPTAGYHVDEVTQSGVASGVTIEETSENVYTITYAKNATGTSTVSVTFAATTNPSISVPTTPIAVGDVAVGATVEPTFLVSAANLVGSTLTLSSSNDKFTLDKTSLTIKDDHSVDEATIKVTLNTSVAGDYSTTITLEDEATPTTNKATVTVSASVKNQYTINWYNGASLISSANYLEGQTVVVPDAPGTCDASISCLGWTTAPIATKQQTAPDPLIESADIPTAAANVDYYAVFAKQTLAGWRNASLASLTSTDIFVIVGNNGDNYAMSNNNGASSAPSAIAVTISEGSLTSTVTDAMKWNVSGNATDGYTFYPNGSTTSWLYLLADNNNGARVGTGTNKVFTINGGYLYTTMTNSPRYIGVYNSSDWRCYTSNGGNIAGQTFAFYKYIVPKTSDYMTTCAVTFNATYQSGEGQGDDYIVEGIAKNGSHTVLGNNVTGFTRAGYIFSGWKENGTDRTAGYVYSDVTTDLTFIAQWTEKADAGLAFDPTTYEVEMNGTFDAPILTNLNGLTVTYSSSDESKAKVNETTGAVTLVPNAVGEVIITASSAETDIYKAGSASYTIKIGEAQASQTAPWVAATELYDGMQVLLVGYKTSNTTYYSVGSQSSNNRSAVEGSLSESIFTPGIGAKAFTLEAQNDGTYAIKTSTGEYLYAASNSSNNMKTKATVDANAKWTITLSDGGVASIVAESSSNRNVMLFNHNNILFSCYANDEGDYTSAITLYTPQVYKRTVREDYYGTICLPKAGVLTNGVLYEISYYDAGQKKIFFDEVVGGVMVAGAPYIFMPNENITELKVVYTNVAVVNNAGHKNGLYGHYDLNHPTEKDEAARLFLAIDDYFLLNNEYWKVDQVDRVYVDNYRAYIKLDKIGNDVLPQAYGRRRIEMNVNGEQTATGMDELNASEAPVKMMINGQLFILRGEKLYDATGRLVK